MENRMHLTPRLRLILSLVPEGARLADIGTDHGLIPAALLRRGTVQTAIASDIRPGPLESARRTAEQFDLTDRLTLRLGAGLRPVRPEEADTIVIAGMGGETIRTILADDPWALDGAHLLLLQAMTARPELRQYLAARGGVIEGERLCREGRRFYTVMAVRGGGSPAERPLADCCVSEALLCDPLADAYLSKLLELERGIVSALTGARRQKPEELRLHQDNMRVLLRARERLRKEEHT